MQPQTLNLNAFARSDLLVRKSPPCEADAWTLDKLVSLHLLRRGLNRAPKISFVSLGCPKALVDSERIIGRLGAEGFDLAKTHRDAEAVIVNTCGFLDSAKAESPTAIGAAAAENGKVIVTGCMGAEPAAILERFPDLHSSGSAARKIMNP